MLPKRLGGVCAVQMFEEMQTIDLAQIYIRVLMHFWVRSAAHHLFSDLA